MTPEQAAGRIIDELGLSSAQELAYLREICCARGAYLREIPLESCCARMVSGETYGVIAIDSGKADPSARRLAAAHALAHFELHRGRAGAWTCSEGGPRSQEEDEADRFALELLLPARVARAEIAGAVPSLALARGLAARYEVPLAAAARRFAELSPRACAAVTWSSGGILQVNASELFAAQGYRIPPAPLSAYSLAHNAHRGKPVPDAMTDVEASAWFPLPPYLFGEKLLEHSFLEPGSAIGVTLLWIPDGSRLIRKKPAP